MKWIKQIYRNIVNIRIVFFTYDKTESQWTVYKRFWKEYNVDTKLLNEMIALYGHNFTNLVEYEADVINEHGHTIYKVKEKQTA